MSLQVSLFDWLYNIISSQFSATIAKCSEIFNYTGSDQLTIYRTTASTKHFTTGNQLIKKKKSQQNVYVLIINNCGGITQKISALRVFGSKPYPGVCTSGSGD